METNEGKGQLFNHDGEPVTQEQFDQEKYEDKIYPVIEYLEDLQEADKMGVDLAMSGDAINHETKKKYTPEEMRQTASETDQALQELKEGNSEKALGILQRQLEAREKHADEPFWNYREDAKPTDEEKIEEEKKRVQGDIEKIKKLIERMQ